MKFRAIWKSFGYAFEGIKVFFKEEAHAIVHLVIALLTIIIAIILSLTMIEWILIIMCIFSVIAAEIFNTAIERLSDRVTTEKDPLIKKTKDLASAAVLVLSIMSVIIGLLIFIPKFYTLLF